LELRIVGLHAVYVRRMLLVKDVNGMALWNCHGVRIQSGVKSADVASIRI